MELEEVYEPEIGVSNEKCDGTDKWLASIRIAEQSIKHLSEVSRMMVVKCALAQHKGMIGVGL